MPRSPRDPGVCLVGGGHAPGGLGGVETWARSLARHLPQRSVIVRAGGPLPRAAVYHALTPAAAAFAAPYARAAGAPLVLTLHAMEEPWRPEGLRGPVGPDASGGGFAPGCDPQPEHGQDDEHGHRECDDDAWGDDDDDDHDWDDSAALVTVAGPRTRARRFVRPAHAASGYAAADAIVAVSHAVRDSHSAAGAPDGRMRVIPNGAPRGRAAAAPDTPLVGFVGRLAPVKGIERLLRAFVLVRAAVPGARMVIVGPDDGPRGYAEGLRRTALDLGLRGAVAFTGPAAPARLYPRMSCLAMASETEGMPLAVLEAMAHGVPCVAPDVGGVREAVGDAGVVVPPRDATALAAGIAALLADPAAARAMGARARARASAWTDRDVAASYAALYRELVPA